LTEQPLYGRLSAISKGIGVYTRTKINVRTFIGLFSDVLFAAFAVVFSSIPPGNMSLKGRFYEKKSIRRRN